MYSKITAHLSTLFSGTDSTIMRRPSLCRTPLRLVALLALLNISALTFITPAQATIQDAQSMLRQGQQSQALDHVNQLITANPKDRSARFLKGVILTEMNKLDEAATVFTKLTEEAPELPEPYNNLAVIYAQQKQYDKAKAALEMAIRTHPSYAMAHENLGDLYAKLARQAYDRALQIDAGNSSAQTKLNLIREIISSGARPSVAAASAPIATKPTTVATAPVQEAPKPAVPAPSAKPAPGVVTAPSTTASAPTTSKPTPVVEPVATAKPVESPVKETPKATDQKPDAQKAIQRTVQAWAAAWSAKNTREYLSYYAKDFQVPERKSRSDWEKERVDRVGKPGAIKVSLADVAITTNGDTATVKFKQSYESASFKSSSGKTLQLALRGGKWQIVEERIGR